MTRGPDYPAGVVHMDGNEASQDYLRQSWPLQDDPIPVQADFVAGVKGTPKAEAQQRVNHLMERWIGQFLPDELRQELQRRGLTVPQARYGRH